MQGAATRQQSDQDVRTIAGRLDGVWTSWTAGLWGMWSAYTPEDLCQGQQTRARARRLVRDCVAPACGGTDCPGDSAQVETDTEVRQVDGRSNGLWVNVQRTDWSTWTAYSGDQCGGMLQRLRNRTMSRTCQEPTCGGVPCNGSAVVVEMETENKTAPEDCADGCERDGGWSDYQPMAWSQWVYNSSLCDVPQVS
jgi:hypothetical protein